MKRLVKMRLINWHRFQDETIPFSSSTVITGANGAGKSTILDALQFVLTRDTKHFNKAAHEKGKRTLNSYIRCKIGSENTPYLRTGQITCHIALEFRDDEKRKSFVVGSAIDSYSEQQDVKVKNYLLDNTTISKLSFIENGRVLSTVDFKNNNNLDYIPTIKDAKRKIKDFFGKIDDKFFDLIPKALAFREITDIKSFVNNYVLNEKTINIEELRRDVKTYQDFKKVLDNVKSRISELSSINSAYQNYQKVVSDIQKYEIYSIFADIDSYQDSINKARKENINNSYRLKSVCNKINELKQKIEVESQLIDNLNVELANNSDYLTLQNIDNNLAIYKQNKEDCSSGYKAFNDALKREKNNLKVLKASFPTDFDDFILDDQDLVSLEKTINELIEIKKVKIEQINKVIFDIENTIKSLKEEITTIKKEIAGLKEKKPTYDINVTTLRDSISDLLQTSDKEANVKTLCELLEIKDESWRNAIEGYLNTQRFYLVVKKEHYDFAASQYHLLKKKKKITGVGLINPDKLKDIEPIDNSLFEEVTSTNKTAQLYTKMILGRVAKCDSVDKLKNYNVAITKDCMKYQNNVLLAIPTHIYQKPYIGTGAIEQQLKIATEKLNSLYISLEEVYKNKEKQIALSTLLDTTNETNITSNLPSTRIYLNNESKISNLLNERAEIMKNSTIIDKQMQLEDHKKVKSKLESQKDDAFGEKGGIDESIKTNELKITDLSNVINSLSDRLSNYDNVDQFNEDYRKLVKTRNIKYTSEYFAKNKNELEKNKQDITSTIVRLMSEYKNSHQFGAAASVDSYTEFQQEYQSLVNSKLVEYETKVSEAQQSAEIEFREDFLSKMHNYIKDARNSIKELNKTLKEIPFNSEKYEFTIDAAKNYENFYKMINDESNISEGISLFTGDFNSRYQLEIEELFNKLSSDENTGNNSLDIYTDYRNYMDYDIKVTDLRSNDYYLYSKVSSEKSGGEIQTPFYITVAASFKQMYESGIDSSKAGLIMIDEAFNNMDDQRIESIMKFMKKLQLQIIISCPTERLQYISQNATTNILVLTDGKTSYVEDYSHEEI